MLVLVVVLVLDLLGSWAGVAFMSLHAALSIVVTNFPKIAQYANVITRLSEFLDESDAARAFEADAHRKINVVEAPRVELEHLSVFTPGRNKTLIHGVSANASELQPLLIQGPRARAKLR